LDILCEKPHGLAAVGVCDLCEGILSFF